MQENTLQCLDLAEKIIAVLDGGEVFKKYSRIKQKIYNNSPHNLDLDPHLKKIALENRDLQKQLEELRDSLKNSDTLENYIISGLQKIQAKVVPNSTDQECTTIDEALQSLGRAIDSKLEANASIREQYTRSNTQLREKISTLMATTNEQLDKITNRHIEQDHQFRAKSEEIDAQIQELNSEIEEVNTKLKEITDQNNDILLDIKKVSSQASSLNKQLSEADKKNKIAMTRYKDLQSTAELLSTELETKTREIKMIRAQQRFNTMDVDEADIEELELIEAALAQLEEEHKKLELELKKRRLAATGTENSEVTKLSTISQF
ncbi:hypothetical protein TVAG_255760 [Trichomonas vaginalis G3]|uniref:Uncharacterized protein n=1 Tax=Trichomonas vaginalis (strain ATCC PRA-98 / G3) TaxID=412133 RepID=A2DYX3_TRIV3|nr:hypothetical protein TVAGG3_0869330 [Trichomonas vaginalis G3]EAY14384.1 hypothetical protein TVAG_255760 [Trichomonas vaginalis G3]KAI5501257.1 hypothetical protein TVAGG3_0869330 [Trichomonas vaginalis G3]|eukprot:XP_001326607.1 hypothetical protein [Trichomonas vaginalis G3]